MWNNLKQEQVPKPVPLQGHNLEDSPVGQVDIPSKWQSDIMCLQVGEQTDPIVTHNASAQAHRYTEVEVQTDSSMFLQMSSGVADETLSPFLSKMLPGMEACLHENAKSSAFEESDAMADNTQTSVEEVHTLSMFDHNYKDLNSEDKINPHQLKCTATSWNSTGYVLGVAYGRFDVSGWTDAPGWLCTWNLGRKDIAATKPDLTLEVDAPLQCIAFHPSHPALIAGGTLNGELYVWDLSRDDNLRGKSRITDLSHREPVTQVVWHFNAAEASKHSAKENAYQVITLSTDGRLLIWNWQKMDTPVYAYELVHPHPRTQKRVLWGGTALAFHSASALAEDRDTSMLSLVQGAFVVGTDGGTVYRCMFSHNAQMETEFTKVAGEGKVPKLRSPVRSEFGGHSGPVHAVDCSPFQAEPVHMVDCSAFQRNVFATCGIDGSVQIYNALQGSKVTMLEPASVYLYHVQWSPHRPLVLAASTGDGRVAIYDLLVSKLHPAKMVDVCGKSEPVHSFAFNPHLREYFTATAGDTVKVYEIGESFSEPRGSEQRLLNQLADVNNSENIFNQ